MSVESEPTAGGVVAGLSIDDRSLRVVVIERGDDPVVVEVAEADLAPDTVCDGRVVDQPALARRIGELWHALDLGGIPTFLGLHPLDGEVDVVAVADWPRSGWPLEVRAAASRRRRELDAEPVWNADRFDTDDGPLARIVSCRREDLSSAVWAARRSGVWLAGVELSALALERVLLPGPQLSSLLVDSTGAGPVTVLLLQAGVAVRCWRTRRTPSDAAALTLVPLDATTAQAVLQEPDYPWADLVAARTAVSSQAQLVGPGTGLATGSPVPRPGFAAAFGLALAAAGVGAVPVDLQPALLHSGTARLQARMGSLSAAALSTSASAAPPPPAPGVGFPAPEAPFAPAPQPGPVVSVGVPAPVVEVPPAAEVDPGVPIAEVAIASAVVPGTRPIVPPARSAAPSRALAVEAFLAGAGPLMVPDGSDGDRASSLSGRTAHGPGVAPADSVGSGVSVGRAPSAPLDAEPEPEPEPEQLTTGTDPGRAAPVDSPFAEAVPAGAEQGVTATTVDEGLPLPRRGRRAATVAVVAGAAAVGSFLVVRNVLPDSPDDGGPPVTTEAPAAAPKPGRP